MSPEQDTWYSDAAHYWDSVPATVNGMLGGFEQLTEPDVRDSLLFIQEYVDTKRIDTRLCCDCGAGIGRVSRHFLLQVFDKVDLVEQCSHFLEQAKTQDWTRGKVDRFINQGLQEFVPETQRYDLIWCQWVMSHLKDDDFIQFLMRCKAGLTEKGLVGIKENVSSKSIIDPEDSSVTRSEKELKKLIQAAGFRIIKEATQTNFPPNLFKVKMYMLDKIE